MARLHDLSTSFKGVDPVWVKPGGTVTYTVYVYNSGIAQAEAEMRDELLPDLSYVSGSLVCGTGSCGYASGVITWTGVVYPRSMVPVRFLATVGTEVGRITNTAVVTDLVWNVGYREAAAVGIARRIYLPVAIQRGSSGYDWGDSDGRGSLPGVTFEWVDISDTGTQVFLGDDDYAGPIGVGFSFDFYGNAYSELYASSNGFLSFEAGSWEYSNEPIASTSLPNNIISLMWDDLDPGDGGDPLYYEQFATCPIGDRACLVVQYDGYNHYPGYDGNVAGTFEAVLFEGGDILIQFLDAGDEAGAGSTTGIENSDGTRGIEYAYDTAILHDSLAILFRPSHGSLW